MTQISQTRAERNQRAAESALANPAKFVGAVAYTILRRWRRDLLYAHTDDALQLCELLKLEVAAEGIAGAQNLTRFAQRRVNEFAQDYGFGRLRGSAFDCRQDVQQVSLDGLVASYQNVNQEPSGFAAADLIAAHRCARKSRAPDPGQVTERCIMHAVARNLRRFRERRGLNMHGLAQRACLDDRSVSHAENLVTPPALTTLFAIAHALDLATDCLLTGEQREPSAADFAAYQAVYVARLKRVLELTVRFPSVFMDQLTGGNNFFYQLQAGRVPQLRVIAYLCRALELWPWWLLKESR